MPGKGSIKSNIHLVPTLKGAVDPKKGIVFRTYYIRPEKLQQMIREAQQLPTKTYILHIPNYTGIEYAAKTGNIVPLYDTVSKVPGGVATWENIQKRHSVFPNHAQTNHHQQKLFQGIYGFILSNDKIHRGVINKTAGKAAFEKKLQVTSTTKENKPKLQRTKRKKVREQFRIIKTLDELPKLDLNVLTARQEPEQDYGYVAKYKQKLYKIGIGNELGTKLSAFLNYLNTNPAKVRTIVSQFISQSTLTDKYKIVGNTQLKAHMYFAERGFWSHLLVKLIEDLHDEPDQYRPELKLFYNLILGRIDKKQAKLILATLPTPTLSRVANRSTEKILQDTQLNEMEKIAYIASLTQKEAERDKAIIMSAVDGFGDSTYWYAVGALLSNLSSQSAYELIKTSPEIEFDSMLQELHTETYTFKSAIIQLIFAKLLKYHFVPYNQIIEHATDPYSLAIATKIIKPLLAHKGNKFKEIIALKTLQTQKQLEKKIEVGLELPLGATLDKQVFIRLNPIHKFERYNKHPIKGVVSRQYVLSYNPTDNTFIVINPIDTVQFIV